MRFTDERKYFVSEASVYRLLKAHDLITSPAYVVIKAANEFKDKTTRPTSSGRPTSPTSRSPAGAGTISRPCSTTSRATSWPGGSVPRCAPPTSPPRSTWRWRPRASTTITVVHRPRLLRDNGSVYVAGDLAKWLEEQGHAACARRAVSSADPGQDRALASDPEEPHPARQLLSARRSRSSCIGRASGWCGSP